MVARLTPRTRLRRVLYSFPLQLLVLHFKKNHLLLLCWLVLFGYITSAIGVKYGIPNLFLYPEYFAHVDFWSYGVTGFAFGGFITAFNLYAYTLHAYRFPFLVTVARPFWKFSVNNGVIPGLFVVVYLVCSARFQSTVELEPFMNIARNLLGFTTGMLLFLAISTLYFSRTNTDIHKLTGKSPEEYHSEQEMVDIIAPPPITPHIRQEQRKATRWLRREQRTRKWHVETYLTGRFRVKLARSSAHYDKELLRSILWQNHINGSIFEVVVIITFIALGAFSGTRAFEIPAGASAFLLFTMLLMLLSALFSWLKGWTVTLIIALLVALNMLSHRTDGFLYDSQAYGLDYGGRPADYTREHIAAMAVDRSAIDADVKDRLATLERWRSQQRALGEGDRPLMVIVNTSGGGLRAMLWTLRCLQAADSLMNGTLMSRTSLITGSSGGLIGATYFRQLYAASLENDSVDTAAPMYLEDMSADILNPIAFSFVTNDMFIRYRRVSDGRFLYTLDRGSAFERRLNELTRGVLDVRMADMAQAERDARLPMLVIAPTSINDGRRLMISSQPVAYLSDITSDAHHTSVPQPESIEFGRLFADHSAGQLKLSSALRMTSTFPYITPVVSLPSEPPMRVMDSGIRDNYGYRTTFQYLRTFEDWIAANTRGVVILQVRDKQRDLEVKPASGSLGSRMLDPVGSVYSNFVRSQDQDYDLMLRMLTGGTKFPIEVIDLQLRHDETDEISLSWHLTALEKRHVLNTINSEENKHALDHLQELVAGGALMVNALAPNDSATVPAWDPVPRR